MTNRKKKGVGFFVSGALFIVIGIFTATTGTVPEWFSGLLSAVGLAAEYFGFSIVYPDTEE
jgi:hypothetical protein